MVTRPDYLLVGHMTADLTPEGGRVLGGTVSYAARTACAFGLRVGVLTSAAKDDALVEELGEYVDDLIVIPGEDTSTFENIYTPDGRDQYIRGVAERLTLEHLPQAWRDIPLVHFGPLTGEIDPAVWFAAFPDAITLMTGQGLLRQWGDDGHVTFKTWFDPDALRTLDWLVLSEEDIVLAPELEAQYAAAANHFVLTRAEKGGTHYFAGSKSETYDTPQVEVLNPTGAGDVFAAALLCSLHLLGNDPGAAFEVAATVGATSVTRSGWDGAPTPDEVNTLLDAVKARKTR